MCSRDAMALLLVSSLLLVSGVQATYAGDKPLGTVFQGDMRGNYLFTTGTSTYSSGLKPGHTCNATFSLSLPAESTVRFGRLYVYWAWSQKDQKAVYPVFQVYDTRNPTTPLSLSARYADSKGFVSSYDFYSGTDAYDLPRMSPGENTVTVVVSQDGSEGSSVLVFGMAALVVYASPGEPHRQIQVKEGCDLLFSSYGVSPEMATNDMSFEGPLSRETIESAGLFLVAPSGGYSRDIEIGLNSLSVNRLEEEKTPPLIRTIFSLLFPNYGGKEWSDIFSPDNTTQIGFETKEIRPYLKKENNRVAVQDQGDYMQLTNAVLAITYTGESS